MQSKAKTVAEYLASLPEDRRAAVGAVRRVILENLDGEYEEGMAYGMIGYFVPHRVYPAGYHCDRRMPLPFASLASQKNHMSLGIMSNYGGGPEEKWFRAAWVGAGKKLDMGACCVRFKRLEDVPLEVVGESIRRSPARKYIAMYEGAKRAMEEAKAARTAKVVKAAKPGKAKGVKGKARAGVKKKVTKKAAKKVGR